MQTLKLPSKLNKIFSITLVVILIFNFIFIHTVSADTVVEGHNDAYAENGGWLDFGTFDVGDTEILQEVNGTGDGAGTFHHDGTYYVKVYSMGNHTFALSGWAWADNIGWIQMSSTTDANNTQTAGVTTDPSAQTADNYGIFIDASGYFRGYAWSTNGGWVSFYENIFSTGYYTQTQTDYNLPFSTITYPQDGASLKNVSKIIGTSSDADTSVASTRISIYDRNIAKYFNGTDFIADTETWLTTTGSTIASTTTWYYNAPTWLEGHNYTIRSRAIDTSGNEEHTDAVTFIYDTVNGQDGSIYVSNPAYQTNANYIIYFPTSIIVPTNGSIEVAFPPEYVFSPWIADEDIILSSQDKTITGSTDLINRANKTIKSTITAGSVNNGDMFELNISNLKIHNPTATGSYAITMTTYDNVGALLESGTGSITIIKPYGQVEVNVEIAQSIQIATSTGTVNLEVDPDTQLGQNWVGTGGTVSDFSDLEVKTNAFNGYTLLIQLAGNTATGSAVLDGSGFTTHQISSSSGDRVATENNFAFALNNGASPTVSAFTNSAIAIPGAGTNAPTNSYIDNIFYYLNVDHTTPSDTYKGKVTYTAVGSF